MFDRERRGSFSDSTVLIALVAVTAAAEVWLAWRYYGFLTGDDVEILSEAFRVATGYSYRAWDIRCLFIPDFVVAPFVWLGTKFGVRDVHALIVIATIPSIVANAITIVLIWSAARAAAWPPHSRIAAFLFALHWIPLGFASTVYPRTIATACILGAFLLVRERPVIAGMLAAIAFADRFSEVVFLIPLLIMARKRAWIVVTSFVATATLVVGFYDSMTWGEWFGSLRKFAALTLVESDFASRLKHQSPFWYLLNVARWFSPALLPFLWIARKEKLLLSFIVIPLIALSFVAHKELRYMHGVLPYAMLMAAVGFGAMRQRRLAVALLAIGIAWNLYGIRYFMRKSMPAVDAARVLAADPRIKTAALSQPWAYGDRLYLTERINVVDIGTPPHELSEVIPNVEAIGVYDTDLTDEDRRTLREGGFVFARTFRNARARDVVVFTRSSSGTSDRGRR